MRLRPLLLLALFVTGCAQRQALFVVLPNADGSSGAITVSDNQKSVLLDKPYASSEEKSGSLSAATTADSGQVQQVFGNALNAQPILPKHFRLYFLTNTETMTPESQQHYAQVFDDIKQRPVYQVEVIGYTDTTGTQQHNQALSLKRAEAIRDLLVKDKLDPKAISVAGRGELDPAVPTGPQVSQPANRRVEITVR